MFNRFARSLGICVIGLGALAASDALALDAPSGPVILVVSGAIGTTNVGDEAHFDRAMLAALPQHDTLTHTPWHDDRIRFSGPLGRTLLQAVDARGSRMRVTALNGYASTIPVADFHEHDVILALAADGEPLSVRDQGPLFVIYPFDDEPDLSNKLILSRSVWQVERIVID
ncbi:oxidoreductase [Halomonas sp. HP20-15]|uniref:oxidoreductase n=1 Tax=Halomonas sp. HP20-15 TaxID=3085901 RepID=UPI0029824A1F|nr:oxidoreductase [Halomonas sp. HP20-15]MDW5377660.1 oxidoreductase [Halomonas sp. HP20-15]